METRKEIPEDQREKVAKALEQFASNVRSGEMPFCESPTMTIFEEDKMQFSLHYLVGLPEDDAPVRGVPPLAKLLGSWLHKEKTQCEN